MQITPSGLAAVFKGFNTRFNAMLNATKPIYRQIAMDMPSDGESNVYGWMAKLPRMRKWLGERQVNNLSAYSYELKNDTYEDTFSIEREKIEDDKLGLFGPHVDMLAQQTALWPDDIVVAAMVAGSDAASITFDGVPFFSQAHPINPKDATAGTQSNYITGAGSVLSATNLAAVKAAGAALKGEDGRVLKLDHRLLVVPSQLEKTARTILNADMIANAAGTASETNVMKGSADLLVLPELNGDPNAWYLLDVSKPIKPFLFQLRRAPNFSEQTDPGSDAVFMRKEYVYGADARGAAGYGLYHCAIKCAGA